MTYADSALLSARSYLMTKGWPGNSIGIVGNDEHKDTGGYHCGNDWLDDVGRINSDYSKRESSRDRPGSDAAMALDIGGVPATLLRNISAWIVTQCKAGTPDTKDIREVIYFDGTSVKRWDRLGIRSSGDSSHQWHTHISYFRDSEGRDKATLFKRYYGEATLPAKAPSTVDSDQEEEDDMLFFAANPDGKGPRWALVTGGLWVEYDAQDEGTWTAVQSGKSYTDVKNDGYKRLRQPFERDGRVLDGTGPLS